MAGKWHHGAGSGLRLACALVVPLILVPPASGKEEAVIFDLIDSKVDQSGIQVFNGDTVLGGNWSSIIVATMPSSSPLRSCTAALVGQRVFLTAAHCVDQGTAQARGAKIRIGATTLNFTCKMADAFANGFPFAGALRAEEDFALCWLDEATTNVPARFLSLKREAIDIRPLPQGSPVLITGYGCTKMIVDLDGGKIEEPPFDPAVFSAGDESIDVAGETRLSTFSDGAREPALCKGDSGGPLITGASIDNPNGERHIRGVNSEVSVERGGLRSYFASLSSVAFNGFLACWRKAHPSLTIGIVGEAGLKPCAAQ